MALLKAVRVTVAGWFCLSALAQTKPLKIDLIEGSRIRVSWTNGPKTWVPEISVGLAPANWRLLGAQITSGGEARRVELDSGSERVYFRLHQLQPAVIQSHSPISGELGVSVNRETILRFSAPLESGALIGTEQFFATAAGRKLLGRVEVGTDRKTATLFALEPIPGGTNVVVTFTPTGVRDTNGLIVDANGDGAPGGALAFGYTTHSTQPAPGTAVAGQVFASEPNRLADGTLVDKPLAGVTITVDGAEETLRAVTGADGRFQLDPAPAGRVFVHIDGRTAPESHWPDGAYYPFVGKAWEVTAGKYLTQVNGDGRIFLPLVPAGALKPVSATVATAIHLTPEQVAGDPLLAGIEIAVPPNSLFDDNGLRGGRIGLAMVPPNRLPEPLPVGLKLLPLVITIQTSGPMNFAEPVVAKFPNLSDPVTGKKMAPGAKAALWSFNHDTGRWESSGPGTVSSDGNFVVSDPGYGIRQPGWTSFGPAPLSPVPPLMPPIPPCSIGDGDPITPNLLPMATCAARLLGADDVLLGLLDAATGLGSTYLAGKQMSEAAIAGSGCGVVSGFLTLMQANIQLLTASLDVVNTVNPLKEITDATGCLISTAQLIHDVACVQGDGTTPCKGLPTGPGSVCDQINEVIALANILNTSVVGIDSGQFVLTGLKEALNLAQLGVTEYCAANPAAAVAAVRATRARPAANPEALAKIQQATDTIGLEVTNLTQQITALTAVGTLVREKVPALQAQLSGLYVAMGGFASGFVRLEGGGQTNRFQLASDGVITLPVLLADTVYHLSIYAPRTGVLGEATFLSSPTGLTTPFPTLVTKYLSTLDPATFSDSDRDGIPDFAEAIIGSDPNNRDTDNDGLVDGADPQPLVAARFQLISRVGTGGEAYETATDGNRVYVAAGFSGLIIFDWKPAGTLAQVGQVALSGIVTKVSAEDSIVAAMGETEVRIINVANPAAPKILFDHSITNNTGTFKDVLVRHGLVYVVRNAITDANGLNGQDELWVYDAATGVRTFTWKVAGISYREVSPPFSVVIYPNLIGVQADRDHVYLLQTRYFPNFLGGISLMSAITIPLTFSSISAFTPVSAGFSALGDLLLPKFSDVDQASTMKLADQKLYLGSYLSWRAVDVSDPLHLAVVANPPVVQSTVVSLAPAGNDTLLTTTVFGSGVSLQFNFATTIYDTVDPADTTRAVATFNLPGHENAVIIHDGYALASLTATVLRVAGRPVVTEGGLAVLRFSDYDLAGLPPTVSLIPPPDIDPTTASREIQGGKVLEIATVATDDVLVRRIELLADGVVVATDYNYPFAPRWAVPVTPGPVSLQARATDFGGNTALSAVIVVTIK